MTAEGRVVALFLCPDHGAPVRAVPAVRALVGHGLEGDVHGKDRPDRPNQVLLMDTSTLSALGLRPGDLREQITVEFPGLQALPPGSLLQVGEAVLEVSGPCQPCGHIGRLLGVPDPEAFRRALEGRRGILTAVVSVDGEGRIRVGDPVRVRESPPD